MTMLRSGGELRAWASTRARLPRLSPCLEGTLATRLRNGKPTNSPVGTSQPPDAVGGAALGDGETVLVGWGSPIRGAR